MLNSVQGRLKRLRRQFYEAVGNDRFSRPARDDLDAKLAQYLPAQGFFVEAGALDGYTGSNTYYLEKFKGWRGLLVEPSPPDAAGCQQARRRSHVANCALVPFDYSDPTIELTYGADLSFVDGAYCGQRHHERTAMIERYRKPEVFHVPARTLSSLLDEIDAPAVDFFSLDVEGYELSVLQGLDFDRHAPKWLLVECQTDEACLNVDSFLAERDYQAEAKLSRHDYLFQKRST